MTSKRRENINLVSFICLSFLVISFSKQLLITIIITITIAIAIAITTTTTTIIIIMIIIVITIIIIKIIIIVIIIIIVCSKNYQDKKATFRPFNDHYQAK